MANFPKFPGLFFYFSYYNEKDKNMQLLHVSGRQVNNEGPVTCFSSNNINIYGSVYLYYQTRTYTINNIIFRFFQIIKLELFFVFVFDKDKIGTYLPDWNKSK